MKHALDWNGHPIELAESAEGVLAFVDPLRGVVRGRVEPWPAAEIVQKLYKSRHEHAFRGEDHDAAIQKLGFYSDLQSVHSEDAITWSVFGLLCHAAPADRVRFCAALFRLIDPGLAVPESASISLWRRIPHPDTLVSGGPEIDFLVLSDSAVVLGEAKWLSPVGGKQGENRDKDQIQLRTEFLQKYGHRLFPNATHLVVLGASLAEPVVPCQDMNLDSGPLLLRDLSWSKLCSIEPHPAAGELQAYLEWKRAHSRAA